MMGEEYYEAMNDCIAENQEYDEDDLFEARQEAENNFLSFLRNKHPELVQEWIDYNKK